MSRQQTSSRVFRWSLAVALASVSIALTGWKLSARAAWRSYEPAEGDIVFQSLPRSELVNTIEGATGSPWSHCGVVVIENGRWMVCEAIGDVRFTPLDAYYQRGRDGRFAVYRLKEKDRRHIPEMVKACRKFLGRPYDARYRMDDEAIYCSELIYKGYRAAAGEGLGKLVTLGSLKWKPYRQLIERLEGGPVPVDREMITPRDLAAAEQLERVAASDE